MAEQQETLIQDVEQFRQEEQQIKNLLGQIGGKRSSKPEKIIHAVLIALLTALFILSILRHTLGLGFFDPVFYVEIGVFLVSLKIIWMIHKQTRVAHFQFWILNTIEFRLTDSSKRLQRLEKMLNEDRGEGSQRETE